MKKYIYLDLFHLSLVLSLLRLYPNLYRGVTWDAEPYGHEVYLGDSSAYTQTRFHNLNNYQLNGFVHPKNIDNAIERTLFIHDVNSLCRRPGWNCNPPRRGTNIFAYIVNELQPHSVASTPEENQEPAEPSEPQTDVTGAELTEADMSLIEVLWKQDIDMGVAREVFDGTWKPKEVPDKPEVKGSNVEASTSSVRNPWQGLNYSIDSETGEHIVLPSNDSLSNAAALVPNNFMDFSIEEALSLFETEGQKNHSPTNALDRVNFQDNKSNEVLSTEGFFFNPVLPYADTPVHDESLLEQLQDLQEMVSEAQLEPFQDQYNSLTSHYTEMPSTFNSSDSNNEILNALLQNTTLALPANESLLDVSYHSGDEFGIEQNTNINTLLSFLTNDTDPNPVGAVGGQEQNDLGLDLPMVNLTADNSFLSQLMDEGTIDFSDFCALPANSTPPNQWPASTSNDSAVSSMGSNWSDSCSEESSNDNKNNMQESKIMSFRFGKNGLPPSSHCNAPNLKFSAPRKYPLFGKQQPLKVKPDEDLHPVSKKPELISAPASPDRYENLSSTETPSRSPRLAFIHNHTYHHTGDADQDKGASQKPLERDKPELSSRGRVRGSRDEKRLHGTSLPLTVKDIVELPIEHFNERLNQLSLSEEHLALIRDIRRRGKNKLAARTCRKRKVDQILDLQSILDDLENKRELAYAEVNEAMARRDMLKQKYQRLYQFIFPDRDPPEPIPTSLYFQEDSVVPPSRFPLSSNATTGNDTEHKKRGKHKGASNE